MLQCSQFYSFFVAIVKMTIWYDDDVLMLSNMETQTKSLIGQYLNKFYFAWYVSDSEFFFFFPVNFLFSLYCYSCHMFCLMSKTVYLANRMKAASSRKLPWLYGIMDNQTILYHLECFVYDRHKMIGSYEIWQIGISRG